MTATTTGPVLALGLDPSGIISGANQGKTAIDSLGGSARKLGMDLNVASKSFELVKQFAIGTLAGFGVGFGLQALARIPAAFVRIADEASKLDSRLRLATATVGQFHAAYSTIFDIANQAGASVVAVGNLYTTLSRASGELGVSQQQLATFTRAVSQALTVSGTSAQSASGVLLHLSQAIGAGTVRAEEFNEILEGAPRIAMAAADGFTSAGVSVSKLRSMISEGTVTSRQFFDAILRQAPRLASEMEATADTIGSASQSMANSLLEVVRMLDKASGATEGLAADMRRLTKFTNEWLSRFSEDPIRKFEQLRKDVEKTETRPPIYDILPNSGVPLFGGRYELRKQLKDAAIDASNAVSEESRRIALIQSRKEKEGVLIPLPKPRYDDVAAGAIEERDKKLAEEAKRVRSERESDANKAESTARRLMSVRKELGLYEVKNLEMEGKFGEAAKLRAQIDISAWKEEAKEAGLSADETKKGIEAILEASNKSVSDRLSAGQRMLEELTVAELTATEKYKEAANVRLKISIDEWRERATTAGLSVDQIIQGEKSITAAAKAGMESRLKSGTDALKEMEIKELVATGKIQEATEARKANDIAAWKTQAEQAGLSAEKVARGVELINAEYERASKTGTKFMDAMATAAESIASRIGDEFTSMFMTIVEGGKITAQQITNTFAKITLTTLMQTVSRYAVDTISKEMQIGKAISGLVGSIGPFFGLTETTGASGQTTIGHGTGTDVLGAAKGSVIYGGNVIPFASGGAIASKRTMFPLNSGYGVMGESGSEGIFPLTRTSGGDLGIRASAPPINVKINNYAGVDVKAKEDGNGGLTIDIDSVVADAIGRRGSRSNKAVRGVR